VKVDTCTSQYCQDSCLTGVQEVCSTSVFDGEECDNYAGGRNITYFQFYWTNFL